MFLFTPFPKLFFMFFAHSCPESNMIFFLVHETRIKKCHSFSFSSRFQLPSQQQQQIIAKFVIFSRILISLTHMGSDLSKQHHSAPYCPTQELPKKLHATSRRPKLIAHVHNFKIILPRQLNSEPI